MIDTFASALSTRLLQGLSQFRAQGVCGNLPHAESMFSYCSLAKERFIAVDLPKPILGVVLSGTKEVWCGMVSGTLPAGTVFVLPGNAQMDIVNNPDEVTGTYQAILLEIADESTSVGNMCTPDPTTHPVLQPFEVRLTPHLVEAVIHAASAMADGPNRSVVRQSRLTELLALLCNDPAAAPLFDTSITQRVLRIIAADLARAWKAPQVASALGCSESTFRRRLAQEGLSFAKLLRRERMLAAHRLISNCERSQCAATSVGYASRTHFARNFKFHFGSNPRELRRHRRPAAVSRAESGKSGDREVR